MSHDPSELYNYRQDESLRTTLLSLFTAVLHRLRAWWCYFRGRKYFIIASSPTIRRIEDSIGALITMTTNVGSLVSVPSETLETNQYFQQALYLVQVSSEHGML